MEFTFARAGGWGEGPAYDFSTWRLTESSAFGLTYRPTLRTLLPRLSFGLVFLMVVAMLYYPLYQMLGSYWSDMQEMESWLEPRDAPTAGGLAASARQHAFGIAGAVLGGLVFVAFFPALLCFWSQVRIEVDGRGTLSLATRGVWPRRRQMALRDVYSIEYGAEERFFGSRAGGMGEHYWLWFVRLRTLKGAITLHPLRQHLRPNVQPAPPSQVAELLAWLRRHTPAAVKGPAIAEFPPFQGGRSLMSATLEPTVTEQTFTSFEAMPPELRARAEKMLREGRNAEGSEHYVFEDSMGRHGRYTSLEQMPSDVREMFERLRRKGPEA